MNLAKIAVISCLAMSSAVYGYDCKTVGLYARSIMIFRSLGAPIPTIVNIPIPFPAEAIREEVLNFPVAEPDIVSLKMTAECLDVGYFEMPRRLREMKLERLMLNR